MNMQCLRLTAFNLPLDQFIIITFAYISICYTILQIPSMHMRANSVWAYEHCFMYNLFGIPASVPQLSTWVSILKPAVN